MHLSSESGHIAPCTLAETPTNTYGFIYDILGSCGSTAFYNRLFLYYDKMCISETKYQETESVVNALFSL